MPSVDAVMKCCMPAGSLSAYQASAVGKGCVCQWNASAEELRHVGSTAQLA